MQPCNRAQDNPAGDRLPRATCNTSTCSGTAHSTWHALQPRPWPHGARAGHPCADQVLQGARGDRAHRRVRRVPELCTSAKPSQHDAHALLLRAPSYVACWRLAAQLVCWQVRIAHATDKPMSTLLASDEIDSMDVDRVRTAQHLEAAPQTRAHPPVHSRAPTPAHARTHASRHARRHARVHTRTRNLRSLGGPCRPATKWSSSHRRTCRRSLRRSCASSSTRRASRRANGPL